MTVAINLFKKIRAAVKIRLKRVHKNNTSPSSKETYNSIRTKLLSVNTGETCPIYVVTSPLKSDGKTVNSINLAVSFAEMGKITLLIDANMRNPSIHNSFGINLQSGLSEILDEGNIKNFNVQSSAITNLSIITAGDVLHNPSDLLSSSKMDYLIELMRKKFDYIFIDSPAIEDTTDALILAKKVSGYILVIKNGTTDMAVIKRSVLTLEQVGAKIVGLLLNDVNPINQRYYKTY